MDAFGAAVLRQPQATKATADMASQKRERPRAVNTEAEVAPGTIARGGNPALSGGHTTARITIVSRAHLQDAGRRTRLRYVVPLASNLFFLCGRH